MAADPSPLAPVDRLLLAEALEVAASSGLSAPADVVVIGAEDDALAAAVREAFGVPAVRTFTDAVPAGDPAPAGVERIGLGPGLVAGARLVLAHLPKPLAELEEIGSLVAEHAAPDVVLLAAGRVKHLAPGMNDVLAGSFQDVRASLGRWKSRALVASGPRRDAGTAAFPRTGHVPGLGFDVLAHGGAFAGTKLDIGTRALLDALDAALADAGIGPDARGIALDLGCGTGVLATSLARRRPGFDVIASDRSWAACASATATAGAAGVGDRVRVTQEDAAASVPDASVDLVLLNPPFHDGHAVVDHLADRLFAAAGRVLRPGGSLVTVFNSHLRHRTALEREVGATTQVARTSKFTVTRSVAR